MHRPTALRILGREEHPDALLLRQVPLIRHPAHDLSPKPVMICVLNPAPPSPRAIRPEKQHFAISLLPRDEQGNAPPFVARQFVHRQHVRAALALLDRREPVEAGEVLPQLRVPILRRRQHREQMPAPALRENQPGRIRRAGSVRILLIQLHRQQFPERTFRQRENPSASPRQKHQPARLLLDQPLQILRILRREFILPDAHVAEEHDIKLRQRLLRLRHTGDVIAARANGHAGVEQHTLHVNAGIALHRVAQIPIFPTRLRLDDQHLQNLLANRDVERLLVVVRAELALRRRHRHRQPRRTFI